MSFKSTENHYGSISITIHWLSALTLFIMIGTGFRASGMANELEKAALLKVHMSAGFVILILTLIRLVWWLWADKKPRSIAMPKWQDKAAKTIHVLFYVVILGMVASGIGMLLLSEAGPIIFGSSTNVLPDFWDYLPRRPHGLGARFIVFLLIAHIGAALFHQFIKKDGLIWRMWYRRGEKK